MPPDSVAPNYDPWIRRARLDHVVDGDTYVMLIDLGYNTYGHHSIRLMDVNAPELFSGPPETRQRGKSARDFAQAWFNTHVSHARKDAPNWPFIVRSEKDTQTFARYVAEIHCQLGHSLAQALIDAGHAVAAPR